MPDARLGTVAHDLDCSCGSACVAVMVPSGAFTFVSPRGERALDKPLYVRVCTRCDGSAVDDLSVRSNADGKREE